MRVTVKTLTGKAFEVHVHPATSLLRLKHIILQVPLQPALSFAPLPLPLASKCGADVRGAGAGVRGRGCALPAPASAQQPQDKSRLLQRSELRTGRVGGQEEGIPVEQQRLIVQGKALEDDSLPLRAANVTHATVIHLVLRSLPPSLPQSRSQLLIALVGVWACAVLQCRMRACERVVHADEESVERRESIGGEAGGKGGGYARHAQRAEEEAQGSAR